MTDLMAPHLNKEHHVTVFSRDLNWYMAWWKVERFVQEVIKSRRGMPPSYRNARLQKGQMVVKSHGPVMAILW